MVTARLAGGCHRDSHLDPIYGYFMAILYAMIMGKSDD